MRSVKVFYSYSHKDESYREKLETHLSILERNGHIEEWHDRRISAGREWEEEIDLNLEEADIILLLVSSNFLASDYCYDTETIRAIERHESKEAVVIPIILSPCLWRESKLKTFQSLPRDDKAISTWPNEDEARLEVATGVLKVVRNLRTDTIVSTETKRRPKESTALPDELILEFLEAFPKWYFSPLRIQRWGSKQHGFAGLRNISTKRIRSALEGLRKDGRVKTTTSQKGNTIYKVT